MEHIVFMHGSSEGQSTIIPLGCPVAICNDISNKYFQGRIRRQKSSDSKLSLFVDLYRDFTGDSYCVYSFVNNECFGKNGRDGQYLSISILSKGFFIFPETVYKMLHAAYNQMYATGKIIHKNSDGNDQYVIAQFSDQEEYLLALLQKIGEAFSGIANNQCKAIGTNSVSADYDSWKGTKINIENCNSVSAFNEFCEKGRIFVSEEYETQSSTIKQLEAKIQKLETEKAELERKIIDAKHSEKSKVRKEIDELSQQLQKKEDQIVSLNRENEQFQASIEVISKELDKVAKASSAVAKVQGVKSQYQNHNNKDILKICLLFFILIFTIASSILNYFFFRNISSSSATEDVAQKIENQQKEDSVDNSGGMSYLDVVQSSLTFESGSETQEIEVKSSSEWNVPNPPINWVTLTKIDSNHLAIKVNDNLTAHGREYTFMISSGVNEKQIKISQAGKQASSPPVYGLVVTNMQGQILQSGSTVSVGQRLKASVSQPILTTGYGWKYSKCTGSNGNLREVSISISGNPGETAVISYGDLNNREGRQRFFLRIQAERQGGISTPSQGGEPEAISI